MATLSRRWPANGDYHARHDAQHQCQGDTDEECCFAHVALTDGYVEMFTADELREIAAEMDKLDDANTEDVI